MDTPRYERTRFFVWLSARILPPQQLATPLAGTQSSLSLLGRSVVAPSLRFVLSFSFEGIVASLLPHTHTARTATSARIPKHDRKRSFIVCRVESGYEQAVYKSNVITPHLLRRYDAV